MFGRQTWQGVQMDWMKGVKEGERTDRRHLEGWPEKLGLGWHLQEMTRGKTGLGKGGHPEITRGSYLCEILIYMAIAK